MADAALGGVLSDAGLGLMKGLMGPSWEEEKQARALAFEKAQLENRRLQSQTKLDEARALWESKRREAPKIISNKQGAWRYNPDTEQLESLWEAPPATPTNPDHVVKWQALKGLEKFFGKPFTEFGPEELNSDNPIARGMWDIYGIRSDLTSIPGYPAGPKSVVRTGSGGQPTAAPVSPTGTAQPSAAPATDTKGDAGNLPQRMNNPYNIKVGARTQHWIDSGQAEVGDPAQDGGRFIKFKNPALGEAAGRELLTGPFYSQLTVEEAMRQWSGRGYGAEVAPGIPGTKKMSELSFQELDTLMRSMRQREGWSATGGTGTAPAVASPAAPKAAGTTSPAPQVGDPAKQVWRDWYATLSEQQLKDDKWQMEKLPASPVRDTRLAALNEALSARTGGATATDAGGAGRAPTSSPTTTAPQPTGVQVPSGTQTYTPGTPAATPGGWKPYVPPRSQEQQAEDARKAEDQVMQRLGASRDVARLYLEQQGMELRQQGDERDKTRLGLEKIRVQLAQEAAVREEAERQRMIQQGLEGGLPTREEAAMANDLFVKNKVGSPYYARNSEADKKVIQDVLRIPKDAEEARKAAGELRAQRGDVRAETSEQRAERTAKLGGGVSKAQEMTSNNLFALDKVKKQYYDEMDENDRAIVNGVIQQPEADKEYRAQADNLRKQRREHREALKLAQPHLDEMRVLDTTKYLTELIVPLISTGNIGIGAKLKSIGGSLLQYSPLAQSQFRKQAEAQILAEAKRQGKDLNKAVTEAGIQARILANVEGDKDVRLGLTGLTAQSRLETLSSILIYAHAMATKRGAGGTQRGLIKADLDFAKGLFDPALFTKDPDQLLRNLQALQEYIQHAKPMIEETVLSYGIDPKTRRFVGTADAPAKGTVTLTADQLKLLQ